MSSPTVVIVPGACQPPAMYQPFANALQKHNIASAVVANPSCGAPKGKVPRDFSEDVTAIQKVVTGLLEEGTNVLVVTHSYGGIPASAALKGLGKTERQKAGKEAGVIGIVFVASYALREGETVPRAHDLETMRKTGGFDEEVTYSALQDAQSHFTKLSADVAIKAGTLSISPPFAVEGLFHDIPSSNGEHWASFLQTHSVGALWSKQTYAVWKDIPSTYVLCELDRIIPATEQETMIQRAKEIQPKAFGVVERLDCGHEPIYSKISELVGIVEKAIKDGVW